MKILHVISSLLPKSGGPTTVVLGLASSQARAGLEVSVCTTGKYDASKERDGVRHHFFHSVTPLLFSYSMFHWLRREIGGFHVAHIHGMYRFPPTCAAFLARRAGVPYIIRPHGCLDPFLYKQSRYSLPLKRVYERMFDIPNLNHAAAIHYTAEEEAQRASFLGLRSRPVIAPNGIDWEMYWNLPSRGSFRKRMGIEETAPLVLFLGRINFKKGLDLLIPAFARVLERCPSALLAIVGPDNEGYGAKVRQWCYEYGVTGKVIFVDHLGPEEVKQAYVDADVFVLPSYTENFGMSVVEAMACGCPVVISDQVNIWREVDAAGAGFVTGLDPQQIAEAVAAMLQDDGRARSMGALGRVTARAKFSWTEIVGGLTDIYHTVLEEGTRYGI